MYVRPVEQGVELLWEGSPEAVFDSTSPPGKGLDFEGYRLYLGTTGVDTSLKQISQFDLRDTTGFNVGLDSLRLPPGAPLIFSRTLADGEVVQDTMRNHFVIRGLRDGFKYFLSTTSFDTGNERI